MLHKTSLLAGLTALVLLPLALTGCSTNGSTATGSDAASAGKTTIAVVTHGNPGDAFWDVVKSGAEQAGTDLGATVTYQGDGDPVRQSQLIDSAVATHPDGLIVSMANPDGVKASVEKAVAAGIPVITINSGLEESLAFGAQTHVGQSEYAAGQSAGERLAKAGATKVICVIHEAGNTGLEDRCRGAAAGLGSPVTNVQVDIANLADAQNTIKSTLLADPTIDGVLSLNPGIAVAASQAITDAGSHAQLATFDVSKDVTTLIEAGSILFAVDQQPYSQGYLPVVFLTLQKRNGDVVGGGQPVFSGPGFVTKENAAQVATYAAHGTR
ncbi:MULTISPECIES: sugar ABC transporter substrate-binding protein [unclassified Cryobacterium]|uniref:sugar ABC transporter substrate-binding protein n=1 Tax=unclassified Cryobacterium TaxID=2649013 RepID=UPI00106DD143|nr:MULTISPECIES: sugar ABC transporter substrate-binding protein [unclassified Cryobacterium]MDY7528805.1 sugar ABC transporter substrate-binding protein [Cryobacterium sp. 10C2]MDY7555455.1 sugar ABC transporter substrate-binding protein [Cryobacterium sp. 10C3]MEB0001771.1 sugar ABC transporter substrate-binding protein [Cryobacterium sp. RTC2.1]MEB0201000.1 sugar ABC transporter substrate-binding protein [Cryobacterium sp. 5I3]MEB0285224.1 sugar ABC transporter substrate-binding protein [Cr